MQIVEMKKDGPNQTFMLAFFDSNKVHSSFSLTYNSIKHILSITMSKKSS